MTPQTYATRASRVNDVIDAARPPRKISFLAAELDDALASIERDDVRALEKFGVSRRTQFAMVGAARIGRVADTDLYEPDADGVPALISPVRVQHPAGPEAQIPERSVRLGALIDLVAWDPRCPGDWALRIGNADFLGCVAPQYLDPDPVWVWRSPLAWLRAHCVGVVPLSRDPAAIYSLLMSFAGGIFVEDEAHATELRRILERPWPLPNIAIGPPLHASGESLARQ